MQHGILKVLLDPNKPTSAVPFDVTLC